jgi:hypothetical protein
MNRIVIVMTVVMAVVMATLVGCTPEERVPQSVAATGYPGLPSGVTPTRGPYEDPAASVLARWHDAVLEVTVWGSGSCPPTPVSKVDQPSAAVEITFSIDYGAGRCTADRAPTTWVLDMPATPDGPATLTVKIRGGGVPQTDLQVARS